MSERHGPLAIEAIGGERFTFRILKRPACEVEVVADRGTAKPDLPLCSEAIVETYFVRIKPICPNPVRVASKEEYRRQASSLKAHRLTDEAAKMVQRSLEQGVLKIEHPFDPSAADADPLCMNHQATVRSTAQGVDHGSAHNAILAPLPALVRLARTQFANLTAGDVLYDPAFSVAEICGEIHRRVSGQCLR